MKIKSIIFCVIFLSCGTTKTEIPKDILSENSFIVLLKDVQLAEAKFELHKSKGIENAKIELAHNYSSIYNTHGITKKDFDKTMDYYTQHPEQLEKILTSVLEQLKKDRTILDQ